MLPTGILIAVPAYGGSIKHQCVSSIFGLLEPLAKLRIPVTFQVMDYGDIATVRDTFCSILLASDNSHVLFVDHDMEFRYESVLKMVVAERAVIGCVYPKRNPKAEFAIAHDRELRIENDSADVDGIGMGLCLIAKSALQKLIGGQRLRQSDKFGRKTFGFFDRIQVGNDVLSEDISFCKRWRDAGGTIHALLGEDIGHIGEQTYRGKFLDHLRSSRAKS